MFASAPVCVAPLLHQDQPRTHGLIRHVDDFTCLKVVATHDETLQATQLIEGQLTAGKGGLSSNDVPCSGTLGGNGTSKGSVSFRLPVKRPRADLASCAPS